MLLGKTVSEMNMSFREFMYWQEYLRIEPPDEGDNRRAAVLLAQITNMSGRSLSGNRQVQPADFLPNAGSCETSQQSNEDQINFMKSIGKSDG